MARKRFVALAFAYHASDPCIGARGKALQSVEITTVIERMFDGSFQYERFGV